MRIGSLNHWMFHLKEKFFSPTSVCSAECISFHCHYLCRPVFLLSPSSPVSHSLRKVSTDMSPICLTSQCFCRLCFPRVRDAEKAFKFGSDFTSHSSRTLPMFALRQPERRRMDHASRCLFVCIPVPRISRELTLSAMTL